MINSIETYAEAGHKSAVAMIQGDYSRSAFERNWYRDARKLESQGDKKLADEAFQAAYKAVYHARA